MRLRASRASPFTTFRSGGSGGTTKRGWSSTRPDGGRGVGRLRWASARARAPGVAGEFDGGGVRQQPAAAPQRPAPVDQQGAGAEAQEREGRRTRNGGWTRPLSRPRAGSGAASPRLAPPARRPGSGPPPPPGRPPRPRPMRRAARRANRHSARRVRRFVGARAAPTQVERLEDGGHRHGRPQVAGPGHGQEVGHHGAGGGRARGHRVGRGARSWRRPRRVPTTAALATSPSTTMTRGRGTPAAIAISSTGLARRRSTRSPGRRGRQAPVARIRASAPDRRARRRTPRPPPSGPRPAPGAPNSTAHAARTTPGTAPSRQSSPVPPRPSRWWAARPRVRDGDRQVQDVGGQHHHGDDQGRHPTSGRPTTTTTGGQAANAALGGAGPGRRRRSHVVAAFRAGAACIRPPASTRLCHGPLVTPLGRFQ